jgi:hypothetical protein
VKSRELCLASFTVFLPQPRNHIQRQTHKIKFNLKPNQSHQESSKSIPTSHNTQARNIHSDYTPEAAISQRRVEHTNAMRHRILCGSTINIISRGYRYFHHIQIVERKSFCFAKNKAVVSSMGSLRYNF